MNRKVLINFVTDQCIKTKEETYRGNDCFEKANLKETDLIYIINGPGFYGGVRKACSWTKGFFFGKSPNIFYFNILDDLMTKHFPRCAFREKNTIYLNEEQCSIHIDFFEKKFPSTSHTFLTSWPSPLFFDCSTDNIFKHLDEVNTHSSLIYEDKWIFHI